MKKFLTILFISAGIFGFSNVNAQKIGYISADEIIQLMPEAASVQKDLDQYQQSLYQNAQDKKAAFDEAVQKFYKDSTTMKKFQISLNKKGRNFLCRFKRNCKALLKM